MSSLGKRTYPLLNLEALKRENWAGSCEWRSKDSIFIRRTARLGMNIVSSHFGDTCLGIRQNPIRGGHQ